MSSGASEGASVGDRLIAAGWRQGALFKLPGGRFVWNARPASDSNEIELQALVVAETDTLVVVSHDCDIYADPNKEPYVEAMLCRHETNPGIINNADRNSVREFTVDRASGLLAVARYRLLIAKDVLLTVRPDTWPGDEKRRKRFITWLGRRYDRPALPNDFVDMCVSPAEKAVAAFLKKQPTIDDFFNSAVREICIPFPSSDDPPYSLDAIVYLLEETEASSNVVDAIEAVHQVLVAGLQNDNVVLPATPTVVATAHFPLKAYEATFPLFIEYATYKGDDLHGAEPIRRP